MYLLQTIQKSVWMVLVFILFRLYNKKRTKQNQRLFIQKLSINLLLIHSIKKVLFHINFIFKKKAATKWPFSRMPFFWCQVFDIQFSLLSKIESQAGWPTKFRNNRQNLHAFYIKRIDKAKKKIIETDASFHFHFSEHCSPLYSSSFFRYFLLPNSHINSKQVKE